jgi:hypothetical protein
MWYTKLYNMINSNIVVKNIQKYAINIYKQKKKEIKHTLKIQ